MRVISSGEATAFAKNFLENLGREAMDVVVVETNKVNAVTVQAFGSGSVVNSTVGMRIAIHFDNELQLSTAEVCDEWRNGMLAAEFEAVELAIT